MFGSNLLGEDMRNKSLPDSAELYMHALVSYEELAAALNHKGYERRNPEAVYWQNLISHDGINLHVEIEHLHPQEQKYRAGIYIDGENMPKAMQRKNTPDETHYDSVRRFMTESRDLVEAQVSGMFQVSKRLIDRKEITI